MNGERWNARPDTPPTTTITLPPHSAGRTSVDVFSSQMYRFHLRLWRWELVMPSGGKAPAAAGHSMVFHPPSRTLLVYGGHRPSTAR